MKIVVWTLVFAACAAVGAVVAANTNPFPPGVEDPGARPPRGDRRSDGVRRSRATSWLVRIDTRTYHDLFVGGRCAANWRIDVGIAVVDGPIDGAGAAALEGRAAVRRADGAGAGRAHRPAGGGCPARRRAAVPARGDRAASPGRVAGAERIPRDDPDAAAR